MHTRHQFDRQSTLWKILTNPAFEVVAAIIVVLIATWIVVDTEVLQSGALQVPFVRK